MDLEGAPDLGRSRERFRGAFLGCMLGDALGRPLEMMSASDSRLVPSIGRVLDGATRLRASDDTEMMISVAESLVRRGRVSREDLLATLAANYDPTRGYGHGMKLALTAARRGESAAFAAWTSGSKGNGGAVRVRVPR